MTGAVDVPRSGAAGFDSAGFARCKPPQGAARPQNERVLPQVAVRQGSVGVGASSQSSTAARTTQTSTSVHVPAFGPYPAK